MDPNFKENPERDLVNFPHFVQPLWPSKVRLGYIPDSWFNFFYKKTGVTGPYLFGWGLVTFLLQKEIWVNDHTFRQFWYYIGITVLIHYSLGPRLAKWFNSTQDEQIYARRSMRTNSIAQYSTAIQAEEQEQRWLANTGPLFDAKRENVALQLEHQLRTRLQQVSDEVKRRLNFMVELEETKKRLQQKHMVSWIVDQVRRGVSAQLQADAHNQCILDLKTIASKHA